MTEFTDLTEPADQLVAIMTVAQLTPSAVYSDVDATALEGLRTFLKLRPEYARRLGRVGGAEAEVGELLATIEDLRAIWQQEMPALSEQVINEAGAAELIEAINRGAVELAPLTELSIADHVGRAVAAAVSESGVRHLDPMFDGFLDAVTRVISDPARFPLFDADAAGLVRAMERDARLAFTGTTAARSAEVDAATRFMGFLPSFPDLSLNEVLDLRAVLSGPLMRFRSEMVTLSTEFDRPIDDGFVADVAEAWRKKVAPALQEIRESLAEHGFLREVASIVQGDVRRILSEAGAVWAATHANLLDLSGMATLAASAGTPVLDTAARALKGTMAARHDVTKQGFYFLHKLDEESRKRN